MLLFVFIYSIAEIVLGAVVLLQFGFSLFTGKPNATLTEFGRQLSEFIYQVFRFLTYNTETKPFPFDDWPENQQQSEHKQKPDEPDSSNMVEHSGT
jgi:hypothetical protein